MELGGNARARHDSHPTDGSIQPGSLPVPFDGGDDRTRARDRAAAGVPYPEWAYLPDLSPSGCGALGGVAADGSRAPRRRRDARRARRRRTPTAAQECAKGGRGRVRGFDARGRLPGDDAVGVYGTGAWDGGVIRGDARMRNYAVIPSERLIPSEWSES